MAGFIGRNRELQILERHLDRTGQSGRCLLMRGRRRVGKSRLIEEFTHRAGVPTVFFTASQRGPGELELFAEEVRASSLPGRHIFDGVIPANWDSALNLLDAALPTDGPSVVVIDEFPYLVASDPSIEATFQKCWDRLLSRRPVLLVLVGSDLAMMEALTTHGRPFHQRGTEMVVSALSPSECGAMVGARSAAECFDAYLVTGGMPLICRDWQHRTTMWEYLSDALHDPTSALIVSGERVLAAEFPAELLAREVLSQIGNGERTFSTIARAAGGLQATSLTRALETLISTGVVAKELPLSTKKSVEARYRVHDPYLRLWLQFIRPGLADIERGRGDRVVTRIQRDWTTWRGKVIEPVIREALSRLSPVHGLPPAPVVGGFWTRSHTPEVDIVGADRGPIATTLAYVGSIKWRENSPLDQADANTLRRDAREIPGADPDILTIGVSLAGVTGDVDVALGPEELLEAW
jgi:AAA+ ATPase superfamily predicted ATPase